MYKKFTILLVVISILAGFTYAYDLKWKSPLTFTPTSPSAGDTVTFRCSLKSGGGPSSAVLIHLIVDGSMVNSVTVASMSVDEQKWIEITWTAVAGTHSVDMVIDPNDTISGENQTNNTRSTTITVASGGTPDPDPVDEPNLEILNVSWSPTTYNEDSVLVITYTVKNTGDADAIASKIGLFSGATRIATQDINPLAPGAQQTRTINWGVICGKQVELRADTEDVVSESDETDNSWSKTVSCLMTMMKPVLRGTLFIPDKPDLVPSFVINPKPVAGGKMGVKLIITNKGNVAAPASVLAIQYGGHTPLTWPVPALEPDGHYSIMDKKIVRGYGIYHITFYADYENDVTNEISEANNIIKTNVQVKAPDLKFTEVYVNKTSVRIQQKVRVWGKVKNVGDAKAGPFRIQANFEPCRGIAQGYKRKEISRWLAPGESVNFEFTHRFACLRKKVNYVLIDPENKVIEQNENNNSSKRIVISVKIIPDKYQITGTNYAE